MQVEYITDNTEVLDNTPRYKEVINPYGFIYHLPLNSFTAKKTGRRFVDGEYTNDWVQYI